MVLAVVLPLLPVIVTTYPPAVVPDVPCAAQLGEAPDPAAAPPPQPVITLIPTAAAITISSPRTSRRFAAGSSSTHNPASAIPPSLTAVVGDPPVPPHELAVPLAACDEIVTTALPLGAARLSVTLPEPIAQLGSSTAVPCATIEQLSDTTPVNPFAAVANTVTVFPLVAPGVTLTDAGVAVIVKVPALDDPSLDPPEVSAAAISFAPSTDPQPVD